MFITSGAFHLSKPSDLLPELQGRLPIRVALNPLTKDDFLRILTEPEFNLIRQSKELLKTEGVDLDFTDEAVATIAHLASEVNNSIENIGARRLHTLIEKLLEDISFDASDMIDKKIKIDKKRVEDRLSSFAENQDLSKFIL